MKLFNSIRNTGTLPVSLLLLSAALCFTAIGCSDDFDAPETPTGPTILSKAADNADLDILVAALNQTGLAKSLDNINSGQFTLFAPTDAAFLAYLQSAAVYNDVTLTEEGAIAKLQTLTNISTPLNIGTLTGRLTYHIISSEITSSQVTTAKTIATLNNARLSLSKQGSDLLLNANLGTSGAKGVTLDVDASNGMIHTIDKIMAVPSATSTVLTPLGMGVSYTTATPTVTGGNENGTGTNFDILAYAVRKGNMATVLVPNQSPLPDFTIFGPNDAAFLTYLGVAAEADAIAAIKGMDVTAVADLVKKHVVSDRYLSTDLTNGLSLSTLKTSTSVTVALDGADIFLNSPATGPKLVAPNNVNNNGVFHTINAVIK